MKRKGITLIVLIITMLVIIILATAIIVNLVQTNVINNAKKSVQKNDESQINERSQVLLMDYIIEQAKGVTIEQLLQNKKDLNEIDAYEINEDGTYKIIIDGYYVILDEKNLNISKAKLRSDVEIGYKINEFVNGKLNVTVTIKSSDENIQSIVKPNGDNLIYGDLKVVSIEEQIDVNVLYPYVVTLTSGARSIQTIIYEDNKAPSVSIKLEKTVICGLGKTISANITITDEKSDVNLNNCKWVLSKESNKSVLTESDYTETFSNTTQTITTSAITEYGSYYIHVLVRDNVGNYNEVVSPEIVVKNGIEISTPQDLQNMEATGHYYIVNNIDMTGFDFKTINVTFSGTIDGLGHTISNLNISTSTNDSKGYYTGIFKSIGTSTIKNVLFKDVNISSTSAYVGVIAGTNESYNDIVNFEKVGIAGNISASSKVASFIGNWSGNTINFTNCYSRVNLTSTSTCDMGGFVCRASTQNVVVDSCYFAGTMTATGRIGVFVGGGNSTNNKNNVTTGITVTKSYYNGDLFKLSVPAQISGTGLLTENMKKTSIYLDWDFENTWKIDDKSGYPELQF